MLVDEFDYELPQELIAKEPAKPRDSSRLLVLHRDSGKIEHTIFKNIVSYLREGDVLVVNNTKVIPARLFGRTKTGGKVEVLLVRHVQDNLWEVLSKPSRKLKPGKVVIFENGLTCKVVEVCEEGKRIVEFNADKDKVLEIVNKIGHVPLPPYIKREEKEEDRTNYQTIFAREEGAVAAPTAGLHFTEELVKKIVEKGVKIVPITLHVGPGTFKPVKTKVVEEHKLDPEVFYIPEETAEVINNRKGRLIAVGTTVVRTLESCADERGKVKPGRGETSLFIYPGYKFKVVEALITNFHLPKSTLLMLVCAFAGKERVLNAYAEAVKLRYRFYSYGDAMFIV